MNILKLLKKTGALLEGHFILSSGLHSGKYVQCASVLKYPKHAQSLCRQLAAKFKGKKIDAVIAPAIGGILVSYELARALGTRSIFAERKNGQMRLRRNFEIKKSEKVLVAEDVITTGGSTGEVIDLVKGLGGEVVAAACIIDRSGEKNLFGSIRLNSLCKMRIKTYPAEKCPLCKKNIPVDKPGSRL
ncbi:MAG: orotate phosphoribosyltransferase [Candidatus Omnitrophota bacterium]|nr:MAG: orotate phosphoribosyltransferase [Candidatus Omnitrophota bacterium]